MARIVYDPIKFDFKTCEKRTKRLLQTKNYLSAFLLVFSYLESYLLQLLMIKSFNIKKLSKKVIKKKLKDKIERFTFNQILLFNFISSNISFEEYQKIESIATNRNKFTHDLISIDIKNKKINLKLKSLTIETMKLSKVLFLKIVNYLNQQAQ